MITRTLFMLLLILFPLAAEPDSKEPVVLQVREGKIVFSADPEMKLRPGDELRSSSGNPEPLLVRITELYPESGIARIIYGDPEPEEPLSRRPALGLEVQGYIGGVMNFSGTFTTVPGMRITGTRGFSGIHPVVGVEFPQSASSLSGFPVFPFMGMQLLWEIGRFQIIPSGVLGMGLYLPQEDDELFPPDFVGGAGEIGISYLFQDSWRILLGLGYSSWVGRSGLEEDDRYGYNGITLRGGLVWKM